MADNDISMVSDEVAILMNESFNDIQKKYDKEKIIILTDENIYQLHKNTFNDYTTIKIPGGEKNKTQHTVDSVIAKMLELNIDKTYMLVGVGGGVVTDMAGYIASIYKRGLLLGLVPTTILGMTDAAIGGKNGVNVGLYKNMVGTIYRPTFILYDFSFLDTLPRPQWINGFAEIIKHACIKDAALFEELAKNNIDFYINNKIALIALVQKNVAIKMTIVLADEFEKADRYLLNFGHTFGHAIENKYTLPHGHAISIGMVIAATLSQKLLALSVTEKDKIVNLLLQYQLPVSVQNIQTDEVLKLLQKDKKREGDAINFVLLTQIGNAVSKKITLSQLAQQQII